MKRIFSLFLLILLPFVAQSQIVNNSGTTAADSLSVPFYLLDSAGNMAATTTNDSLFLVVFYPSGAESFRDTVAHGNSLITTVTVAGYSVYSWKMAIADIDGAGKDGLYSYLIWVKDHTGAALATPHKGYFQLYQANDYNVWASRLIDSLQAIIDTLQLHDNWVARDVSILDSAFHSRMLGRKIFGIASGSGSDSISLSQRKVVSWGGFVDSNKTEQGGISGANRTWNVYVFDTSGTDTPIPGANVDVQLTNGTVKSRGTTDAAGLTTFTVTDGNWVLVSRETGYVLNNLNKTISASSTDTVKGYDIQVGTPSSPALCRVYGYVYSIGAVPEQGAGVVAFLPAGVARSGSLIISPYSVTTVTDSLGYFYLDLIRSDSLTPSGTMYDFIINRKDGTIVYKRVNVPDQTSWLLQW